MRYEIFDCSAHIFYTCFNAHFRDHVFDSKMRAKRSAQRKLATIADVDDAAKGVGRVRQHHHCDQSKIMAEKRLRKPNRSLPFSSEYIPDSS